MAPHKKPPADKLMKKTWKPAPRKKAPAEAKGAPRRKPLKGQKELFDIPAGADQYCMVPDCKEAIPCTHAFCPDHWDILPAHLQVALNNVGIASIGGTEVDRGARDRLISVCSRYIQEEIVFRNMMKGAPEVL
jgi:hypothetical protein